MLTAEEKEALARWDYSGMMRHFRALARMNRRSDGPGEAEARDYITDRLQAAGIDCRTESDRGFLSFGGAASIRVGSDISGSDGSEVRAKAWNFSAPTPSDGLSGRAVALDRLSDLPAGPFEYLTADERRGRPSDRRRDLEGCVALARASSPQAVLDAEARGAVAYVICWPAGDEDEIHESGTVMWWGLPLPEETCWLPSIPVVAVNKRDGDTLLRYARQEGDKAVLHVRSEVVEEVVPVHTLSASIPSTTGSPYYLLIGAHLDSKHLGATDNATGSALALSLAEAIAELGSRNLGVKICWWSGHEFARYTGSSLYARKHFEDLERHCVAYSNIDMPGIRGSTDFSRVTAGPDLFDLAARTVRDITGQTGSHDKRVRAWDQSFQNIGVSSFFIWSSVLPPESPYRTGGGNMPRWWHTEADTEEYCDPEIFKKDAALYMTGLSRLLAGDGEDAAPNVAKLWRAVTERLRGIEKASCGTLNLASLYESLEIGLRAWEADDRFSRVSVSTSSTNFSTVLKAIRLLNRIWSSARGAHLQDRGGGDDFIPGLSEAALLLAKGGLSDRREVIVRHYAETQRNRICLLARELEDLTASTK